MRVICPYVDLHPSTQVSLERVERNTPIEYIFVGDSDEAYFEVLSGLWADGRSFTIIEHDVSFELPDFNAIAYCMEPWCGAKTPYFSGPYDGMGLVKFDASLMAEAPTAMEEVGRISDDTHPAKHWCRLDAWLQRRVLPSHGFRKHVHDLVVGHSHTEPSHGCRKG